jgi:predicted nucleic acid-binding Zn ribbon protein
VTTWRPLGPDGGEGDDPRPVSASLDQVTRALGAPRAQVLASLFSRWEQLVGCEIAAHARPRSLRGGVLAISVDQPAWATQLRFLAGDLLARIHAETDAAEITEIRIGVESQSAQRTDRGRRPVGPTT